MAYCRFEDKGKGKKQSPKIEEIDKEFEEVMQDLPEEILKMAQEFGAIVRKRKITSPVELLRMVLL